MCFNAPQCIKHSSSKTLNVSIVHCLRENSLRIIMVISTSGLVPRCQVLQCQISRFQRPPPPHNADKLGPAL